MIESEVITDVTTPRRVLVPLTFCRTVRLAVGRFESTINRGETAGVPADQVAFLLQQGVAVVPGSALDPPEPDQTPTRMRLLTSWRSPDGRQWFRSGECPTAPRHEVERVISLGQAVLDDGHDMPATTLPEAPRTRSRIERRAIVLAEQILERYRQ